ncbi:hypothetical protein A3A46_04290 [Candidatus Roizmanbacteria bacterium RIFCSPLOWO2_01_FULL_37_13]|uniref:HIT domain-containing protein n=1 Tax=Candidatus Roizmanbacteria bacterium RIFCSPHIGHO2_02_FULL_38_11 TaxID=1802039 RepID=A0A1F7H1R3_9BACT|nr:MAG: hypothetical protein A3C25_03145 [Candidatus Roizmanbacteria bacterium RIFCSPHIGHO2_02_FULL_38_11]OGK40994.1 MAG: hypothetical protein A3A46_04290 [Candidatus Roizmanbacteria bacterium RIFCSPLOWO2_01_FULL_37_13]
MKCPFCNFQELIKTNEVIFTSKNFYCIKDIKPISRGHILIIPYKHIREINALSSLLFNDLLLTIKKASSHLKKKYKQTPLIFINNKNDQSVNHLHIHLIPKRFGILGIDKALREIS